MPSTTSWKRSPDRESDALRARPVQLHAFSLFGAARLFSAADGRA
jgi:hypothetical protein